MDKKKIVIEGIEIEVEGYDPKDHDAVKKHIANCFTEIREAAGMNRKDFSDWLGIPYRTMQEWERARRAMPEYVLRLIAYKVYHEKIMGTKN